jgi:glycosyltransferase involved in cell wall biosynthesis
MSSVLYLTFDGLLEPLGFSQVVRVVEALAPTGHSYHILSLEKLVDLADSRRVAALRQRLSHSSIGWTALEYDGSQGARSAAKNVARASYEALRIVAREKPGLIHARSYMSALVASALKRATRTPFIFDARGYWVDEKAEAGAWFTTPARLSLAKQVERQLIAHADAIVTLTQLHADDLAQGALGAIDGRPVVVIPTCVDFDDFPLRVAGGGGCHGRLSPALVVGLVGSHNASYRTDEALRLAAHIVELEPDARVLVLTRQRDELARRARAAGLADEHVTIESACYEEMPARLAQIDWGLLLLHQSPAKRASMPTKLAEFFATGVRPVQSGCNQEVSDWVRRAGSGMVLDSTDEVSLRRAAEQIVGERRSRESLGRARALVEPHFSLRSAAGRYSRLLTSFGA